MLSKPMLTVHEVADLLKVKESTVRIWIHEQDLRAVKFGRDWRVAQKYLEAFVKAHANRAPQEVSGLSLGVGSYPPSGRQRPSRCAIGRAVP